MNLYGMNAGECVAAAVITLRAAAIQDHDWQTVFRLVPQHPSALIASAVDDAWLSAIESEDGAE